MSRYAAYIDESGNHDLATEKDGASKYFLILAVVVEQTEVPTLTAAIEALKSEFFGPGEMKSSRVSEELRIRILKALDPLDFRFYAVAVDKARLHRDSGLAYKQSFIKFTNGRLYNALFHHLPELTVYADGHGGSEFIQSFKRYIETNHAPDLFSRPQLEIVDSKNQILVQLADFLVGTAAKVYEDKVTVESRKVFLEFLAKKRMRIDEWPPKFEAPQSAGIEASDLDRRVREISSRTAAAFLTKYADTADPELQIQHTVLSYLLFRAQLPVEEDFVSTQELVDHLQAHGFVEVNKHYLRSNVISKLRDRDVIIASSPKGYKIPSSYADVVGFAELVDGIVLPLLQRLKRANQIFDLGSAGKINVLEEERFRKLRQMLDLDAVG
ncbi:hypothetical protein DNF23_33840 [Pseudomonas syringae pv. pisi]|jgi:hypothetical protein